MEREVVGGGAGGGGGGGSEHGGEAQPDTLHESLLVPPTPLPPHQQPQLKPPMEDYGSPFFDDMVGPQCVLF